MEGRASPRKPRVWMRSRSTSPASSGSSLEVAWRSTASASWSGAMPWPSSAIRMRDRPPPSAWISMRVAPASSAFSTSSLTAADGLSTTSPAAMRLTVSGGRRRMGMGFGTLAYPLSPLIPAKAGTQCFGRWLDGLSFRQRDPGLCAPKQNWVPAFAGMSGKSLGVAKGGPQARVHHGEHGGSKATKDTKGPHAWTRRRPLCVLRVSLALFVMNLFEVRFRY